MNERTTNLEVKTEGLRAEKSPDEIGPSSKKCVSTSQLKKKRENLQMSESLVDDDEQSPAKKRKTSGGKKSVHFFGRSRKVTWEICKINIEW